MRVETKLVYVYKDRQRKDLGDLESLAASMAKNGQLQPIVVVKDDFDTSGWKLVCGERRYRAAQKLGWTEIEAIERDNLSEDDQALIELEENVRRKSLHWTEEVMAVNSYVILAKKTQKECASDLLISEKVLSNYIVLCEAFEDYPHLQNADSWSAAYKQLSSINGRKGDAIAEAVLDLDVFPEEKEDESEEEKSPLLGDSAPESDVTFPIHAARVAPPLPLSTLHANVDPRQNVNPNAEKFAALEADFRQWASSYSGSRFNLIHCDFPYGINMHKANLQNSSPIWDNEGERYPDSPELFKELLQAFVKNHRNFVAESAHLIFWLAPKNYEWVAKMLEYIGFVIADYPLIWHKSDNAGIVPDVRRTYRRTYELALFATKGDRKIVRPKAASISAPTTKERHLSEKPMEVVKHFLSSLVDDTTDIFDPTCGGGNALLAAKVCGCKRALGLDIDPGHISYVNNRLER